MERRTLRTVTAILVFVFVLLAIWSGYNLYSDSRATTSSSSHTLADYTVDGSGDFVATLLPNDLCNCTRVAGGNTTLFTAITQTVNVTLTTSISVSAPATIETTDQFAVVLSTAVWSKSIYTAVNQTSAVAARTATRADEYSVNVSAVEALITLIDGQLNYVASQATLSVTSTVVSSIAVTGVSAAPESVSTANLTFFSSTIGASFLGSTSSGSVVAASISDSPVPTSAYLYLALALAALGASIAWLMLLRPRGEEGETILPLENLIAPYEEAIAETAMIPDPETTISVERWEDLVKIADTLGKPILRPPRDGPGSVRGTFYVLDGSVGYLYRYAGAGGSAGKSELGSERPRITTDRLRGVSDRIRAIGPSDARFTDAVEQFRLVRAYLRARRWSDADRAFDALEAVLNAPEARTNRGR